MGTESKKRAAPAPTHSSKKQKLQPSRPSKSVQTKNKAQEKGKGKARQFERETIEIPAAGDADTEDSDVSDTDAGLLQEFGDAVGFLRSLDRNAIARSKAATERLHQLHKPIRKPRDDDLPSIASGDEDAEHSGDSMTDESDSGVSSDEDGSDEELEAERQTSQGFDSDSDVEMPYERIPRGREASVESDSRRHIQGLPIKLADGRIQATGKMTRAPTPSESEDEDEATNIHPDEPNTRVEDVATGARFGRPAVVDVVGNKSRAARIHEAKEQIASICQEIIADPENSLGLLRRLHTFSLEKITSPALPGPVTNDIMIRKLAMLSQLAVFKDIIPGYRIRALTEKEKAEKVSQMVAHTREWEQGLLVVYQTYLRALEDSLKAKDELSDIALKCMCTLAAEVTHFNFRVNLMSCIVAQLSKKSWDKSSDLCLNTLISIFRNDLTGVPSLEIVQLLNRMIKERHFKVHPEVLTCLLHLRLKSELDVRASDTKVDRDEKPKKHSQGKAASRRSKGKPTDQPHLSKKAKKAFKERKEIEKEVREAEAEVDKEERAKTHTETLKLLFVLYFRILKNPHPTPLLPAALRGISKFAHLVNVDFFKDLMQVLRGLIVRESTDEDDPESLDWDTARNAADILNRLLCIVTAFELLSGQGEALNIDLSDFVKHLYAIILPISLLPQINDPPPTKFTSNLRISKPESIADMLFRALNIVFSPRTSGGTVIPWRSAAFAKRLLIASINWPPNITLRALEFIEALVAKDPKLEALLSTEDRSADGVYLPQIDDPQLSRPFGTSFFELLLLQQHHYDSGVREAAQRLSRCTNS
ncbi:nucleolar complex-associated protein-domain-containing protein [Pisolithus albus]|nr:nucleolar complex-associated protein-domain-containing protein [Pisolithus albus]